MDSSSSNGFGKLLPKAINAKRKSRKQKLARGAAADADADDDTPSRRPSSASADLRTPPVDGDDGSLGSLESAAAAADTADPRRPASAAPPTAPALSAHPSQSSYLPASDPATQLDSWQLSSQPPPSRSQSDLGTVDDRRAPSLISPRAQVSPVHSSILDPPPPAKVAPPEGRSRPQPRIDTRPPRTPPAPETPAPVIVSTPPTPVDRTDSAASSPLDKFKTSPVIGGSPRSGADGSGPPQSMSTHYRSKSGSSAIIPSKLSNTTLAPLTPTAESGEETPSAPGFFSSVISAAQNAASTLSSNIPGTTIGIPGNKSRSSLNRSQTSSAPSQAGSEPDPPAPEHRLDQIMDTKKDLAVRTLGAGELSLSQLGIAEPTGPVALSARASDVADARTRSDSAPESQARTVDAQHEEPSSRPRSLLEGTSGDQTPPAAELDSKSLIHRTSSLRSAMRPHRKRGSSTTAGSTRTAIGAAIAAANSSVMNPSASFGAPKLTGFAIASKRRNRDFHSLFKSVPDDDYLIEDYSCALQREILAHGRLYVSEGHLCFSSNILGWTTMLVMSFDEIVSVEKRSTALVFKNGLMISTLHAKHVFASFTSRDATYDLIVNIWKLGHPTLKSTLNGVRLEGTGGDKTEKVDEEPAVPDSYAPIGSESDDDSDDDDDDDDDFYDEEEHEHVPETQATEVSGADAEAEKPALRKTSGMTTSNGAPAEATKEATTPPGTAVDFPGPASHSPTECGDSASHYEKFVGDDIVPAPLGKVYNLVFGPGSAEWMAKWLTGDQKCSDLQMDDKKGLTLDNRTRNYTYIKPLNASIGPRQTKCIVAETLENLDLEKAVNLSISTQNPDVPSGNVFCVKTKYCLSWAENNATRMQVNCTVEWTGKSWLKGPIEKGVSDGQTQYCKDLFAALKASVSSRSKQFTTPNGPPRSKKKLKRGKALQLTDGGSDGGGGPNDAAMKNWGPLEPVRGLVEPLVDVVRPLLTGNVMYGLLVGLLVAMWFGFGSAPSKSSATFGPGVGFYSPYRTAAYEEMWRREESELWEWLEERVGLDRLGSPASHGQRKRPEPRMLEEKLREGRMEEREVEEAIKVTEEKLKVLRGVVAKASRSAERE